MEAKQLFETELKEIAQRLNAIKRGMKIKHKEFTNTGEKNYARAGDLVYVNKRLAEICKFLNIELK